MEKAGGRVLGEKRRQQRQQGEVLDRTKREGERLLDQPLLHQLDESQSVRVSVEGRQTGGAEVVRGGNVEKCFQLLE